MTRYREYRTHELRHPPTFLLVREKGREERIKSYMIRVI